MTTSGANDLPYRYQSRGRTPLNLALLAIGIGMFGTAAAMEARPLIVLAPIAAFTGMLGYLVIFDRRAGMEIDNAGLTMWRGTRRERIALDEIERVHVEHWSDSVDVTIHQRDGGTIDIPDRCRPSLRPLTRALETAGVQVTQS
ncbi:MAG TPA: hypothetical protein VMY41_20170 [Thermohalobaculum sp.]|nr:hypothetical protein [Thermohalobaculum sp.]